MHTSSAATLHTQATGQSKRWQLLLWALALCPALFSAVIIYRYGVDLPRMDELACVGPVVLEDAHGQLAYDHLLDQANETRPLIPRLLGILNARLTNWDTRYEMWLVQAMMVANMWMLIILFRRAALQVAPGAIKWVPLLAAAAGLVVFSPFQTEIIWGFQYIVHIPITCLLIAAVVGGSGTAVWFKHVLCVILSVIATFSYANGMILWVLAPMLLLLHKAFGGRRLWFALAWLAFGGASLWLYWHDYTKPAYHPSFMAFRGHEWEAVEAFLSFFGAPLVRDSVAGGALVGAGVLFCWAAAAVYAVFRGGWSKALVLGPCLVIMVYSLASDFVTTLGRIGFGTGTLMATRYAAFNTYVIGATFFIVPLAFWGTSFPVRTRRVLRWCVIHAVVVYVAAWTVSLPYHMEVLQRSWGNVVRARAAVPFLEQMASPNHSQMDLYFPSLRAVAELGRSLRKAGYMRPGPIAQDVYVQAQRRVGNGYTDTMTWNGQVVTIGGWAYLSGSKRAADAIVATQLQENGERQILGVSFIVGDRPDVAKALGEPSAERSAWLTQVLAPGKGEIEMWAVDGLQGKVYRLPHSKGAVQ